MAIGSTYGVNHTIEAVPNEPYVQLHTGAPGTAGTSNVATTSTRVKVTLGSPTSGVRKNSTKAEWTAAGSETLKFYTLWDASTAGNCSWVVALETETAVTTGGTITLPVEGIALTQT
jgi:hypothetical protein